MHLRMFLVVRKIRLKTNYIDYHDINVFLRRKNWKTIQAEVKKVVGFARFVELWVYLSKNKEQILKVLPLIRKLVLDLEISLALKTELYCNLKLEVLSVLINHEEVYEELKDVFNTTPNRSQTSNAQQKACEILVTDRKEHRRLSPYPGISSRLDGIVWKSVI